MLLGALDVQQAVAQHVQPPRGQVAHESGRHLHPIAPTARWELWLLAPDGTDRQFTVHTREMPARRGHEVSLMTTTHRCPRVPALANWTTIDGVNHARSELPGLVHVSDVLWLAAGFVGMTAWLGDAGMVLFVPAAVLGMRPKITMDIATTGPQAIELARTGQHDLLLIDMHLPDTDGIDLLAALRRMPGLPVVPAIMVSAGAREQDVDRALASGFMAYWTKPLDIERVLATLDALLGPGQAQA